MMMKASVILVMFISETKTLFYSLLNADMHNTGDDDSDTEEEIKDEEAPSNGKAEANGEEVPANSKPEPKT